MCGPSGAITPLKHFEVIFSGLSNRSPQRRRRRQSGRVHPRLGRRDSRGSDHADRNFAAKVAVQFFGEESTDRGVAPARFGPLDRVRQVALRFRRLQRIAGEIGDPQIRAGLKPLQALGAACRRQQPHHHVGLAGREPDFADEHVMDGRRPVALPLRLDHEIAAAGAGRQRREADTPLAGGVRDRAAALIGKADAHGFPGLRPSPDPDRQVASA